MKDTGEKTFSVYMHISPQGKRYIGITSKNPLHRWNGGKAYSQNKHFTRAINAHGWDSFVHVILFQGLTRAEACEREKALIEQYKSNAPQYGYNLSSGGENPADGVKQRPETVRKRAEALRGQRRGPTPAISNAKKGKSNGHEGKRGADAKNSGVLLQIDETTKQTVATFYGYAEMHRVTGYAQTPVKECVKGTRRRAYGYLWDYRKRGEANVSF